MILPFQVSVIKSKIADELGMPPGKQKLQIGVSQNLFLTLISLLNCDG